MKRLTIVLSMLALLTHAQLAHSQETQVPIDTKNSQLRWTGHAEVGTYSPAGTLSLSSGTITLQKGEFAGAQLTIDMASLQQSNTDLTHHLKSPDFFDVEHFPTAILTIERFEAGNVFGTLTIKGKSAPFHCPISVIGDAQHFQVTGKTQLDRTAYGITYNSSSFFSGLGDKAIRNTFEVEFSIAGNGPMPAKYRS